MLKVTLSLTRAPIASRVTFGYLRKTSTSGSAAFASASSISLKAGGSSILSRITRPTATSTIETRNGTRQPHDWKASSGSWVTAVTARVEVSRPIGTPSCGHDENQPRLSSGACSTQSRTAPPHSPPRPMPCSIRRTSSSIGAATPMAA